MINSNSKKNQIESIFVEEKKRVASSLSAFSVVNRLDLCPAGRIEMISDIHMRHWPKWQCVVTNKWSVTSCYGSFQILEGVEMERSDKKSGYCDQTYHTHGCQMAIARFLDHRHLALQAWVTMAPLCCAAKFDPFLSLDCARVKGRGRIWQPWSYLTTSYAKNIMKDIQGGPSPGEPGLGWLRFGEFPQLWAATV